jgi:hypothetical protein
MNRFLYAEANPATLIDPTGHNACLDAGSGCSSVPYVTPGKPPVVTPTHTTTHTGTTGGSGCGVTHDCSESVTPTRPAAPNPLDPTRGMTAGVCDSRYTHYSNSCQSVVDTSTATVTPPKTGELEGGCLGANAEAGLMGSISLCVNGGHLQVTFQVGGSTGIGAAAGYIDVTSDAATASDIAMLGGGGGGSACFVLCVGADLAFSKAGDRTITTDYTFVGLGLKSDMLGVPVTPVEGHAFGSFTIDFNDLAYSLTHLAP